MPSSVRSSGSGSRTASGVRAPIAASAPASPPGGDDHRHGEEGQPQPLRGGGQHRDLRAGIAQGGARQHRERTAADPGRAEGRVDLGLRRRLEPAGGVGVDAEPLLAHAQLAGAPGREDGLAHGDAARGGQRRDEQPLVRRRGERAERGGGDDRRLAEPLGGGEHGGLLGDGDREERGERAGRRRDHGVRGGEGGRERPHRPVVAPPRARQRGGGGADGLEEVRRRDLLVRDLAAQRDAERRGGRPHRADAQARREALGLAAGDHGLVPGQRAGELLEVREQHGVVADVAVPRPAADEQHRRAVAHAGAVRSHADTCL